MSVLIKAKNNFNSSMYGKNGHFNDKNGHFNDKNGHLIKISLI